MRVVPIGNLAFKTADLSTLESLEEDVIKQLENYFFRTKFIHSPIEHNHLARHRRRWYGTINDFIRVPPPPPTRCLGSYHSEEFVVCIRLHSPR